MYPDEIKKDETLKTGIKQKVRSLLSFVLEKIGPKKQNQILPKNRVEARRMYGARSRMRYSGYFSRELGRWQIVKRDTHDGKHVLANGKEYNHSHPQMNEYEKLRIIHEAANKRRSQVKAA